MERIKPEAVINIRRSGTAGWSVMCAEGKIEVTMRFSKLEKVQVYFTVHSKLKKESRIKQFVSFFYVTLRVSALTAWEAGESWWIIIRNVLADWLEEERGWGEQGHRQICTGLLRVRWGRCCFIRVVFKPKHVTETSLSTQGACGKGACQL